MKPKIIVYLPVIHAGYLRFFDAHKDADIFIANTSLIELIDQEFDYLRKEIRAITPQQAEISLESILPDRKISLLGANDLAFLDEVQQKIILPKEDIFIWLAKQYFTKSTVIFDDTFLRWNRENTVVETAIEKKHDATGADFGKLLESLVAETKAAAQLSSDWWRQVGAVVFSEFTVSDKSAVSVKSTVTVPITAMQKNNQDVQPKIIAIAHNHHLPSPYTPYIDSDPRNSFHRGENVDLSTAIHAEAGLIADSAKKGISLLGTSMYASTFPCPTCAKLVAASGIKKLYFSEGYAMLDGERILTESGIEIVRVGK